MILGARESAQKPTASPVLTVLASGTADTALPTRQVDKLLRTVARAEWLSPLGEASSLRTYVVPETPVDLLASLISNVHLFLVFRSLPLLTCLHLAPPGFIHTDSGHCRGN